MKIHEKLALLCRFMNKSQVGRAAKISPSGLSKIISGQSMPGADTILQLARVLGVSVEWLISPECNWPPVRIERKLPCARTDADLLKLPPKTRKRLAEIDAAASSATADSPARAINSTNAA